MMDCTLGGPTPLGRGEAWLLVVVDVVLVGDAAANHLSIGMSR